MTVSVLQMKNRGLEMVTRLMIQTSAQSEARIKFELFGKTMFFSGYAEITKLGGLLWI